MQLGEPNQIIISRLQVESMLQLPLDPNLVNELDESPLFVASAAGHVEVVRLLVDAGADKNFAVLGMTSLMLASRQGRVEMVRLLVEAGADKDMTCTCDHAGATALMLAACRNRVEVVRLLVEAGAEKDVADKDGFLTPAEIALLPGIDDEGVFMYHDHTALMTAARHGYVEVVRLLVEAGADKAVTDSVGRTALTLAARKGHVEVVSLLDPRSWLATMATHH